MSKLFSDADYDDPYRKRSDWENPFLNRVSGNRKTGLRVSKDSIVAFEKKKHMRNLPAEYKSPEFVHYSRRAASELQDLKEKTEKAKEDREQEESFQKANKHTNRAVMKTNSRQIVREFVRQVHDGIQGKRNSEGDQAHLKQEAEHARRAFGMPEQRRLSSVMLPHQGIMPVGSGVRTMTAKYAVDLAHDHPEIFRQLKMEADATKAMQSAQKSNGRSTLMPLVAAITQQGAFSDKKDGDKATSQQPALKILGHR